MSRTGTWVVTYLPTLRTFLHRLRATSATPSSLTSTLLSSKSPALESHFVHSPSLFVSQAPLQMPVGVAQLGLQPALLFPGAVGVVVDSENKEGCSNNTTELEISLDQDEGERTVECKLQECPEFIHDEMMQLFPETKISHGELRMIILSERTKNDMTSWSPSVEEEREELLAHFIDSAKEVCSRLMAAGYWGDFIDPSSGRAFYGCYTQSTLFETDDKFRYMGFDIQDLGCCKCIMHPLWGSYTFVGTIFTNSPMTSPAIQEIINL